MQSKTNEEFQEIAKKIVEEEQPLFDSIQELEKTGKRLGLRKE